MTVWLVKATWLEDEAEANEKWVVNAETVQDAVTAVATHLRFHPHHVEAGHAPAEIGNLGTDLSPGEVRRIP